MNKKILAIIPARKGSKRIPRKNLIELSGEPLISYTINAAIESNVFDRIVVSTDSLEIADMAIELGVEVPILRPDVLSKDKSSSYDVVKHMVLFLCNEECFSPDVVVLLQPTSPLRKFHHIRESVLSYLKDFNQIDSMVSMTKVTQHPEWMYAVNSGSNQLLKVFESSNNNLRTQELNERFYINGAIYITKLKTLLSTNSLFGGRMSNYLMDEASSIDIDTKSDLIIAECLLSKNNL
jgi:CMP-N,N'-diacetyllegionaminic acid synthase